MARPKKTTEKEVEKKRIVTVAELAKIIGVAKATIQEGVESGRLTVSNPGSRPMKFDLDHALEDWEAFRDERQVREKGGDDGDDERDALDGEIARDGSSTSAKMRIAKAEREKWAAKKARLDFLEKKGQLVDANKVRDQVTQLAQITRDAILAVPDRISAELCWITDQPTMHATLTKELNGALQQLCAEK